MRASLIPISLVVLSLSSGCYTAEQWADALGQLPADAVDSDTLRQQWTDRDDPSLFDDALEYRLAELPSTGEAANVPWASSYWPVYEDSINHRWAGSDSSSPAAKYGEAFGVEDIESKVSASNGVDNQSSRTACTTDEQCSDTLGEACAIREGAEAGFCIPTWWGICHAWAPASIMEPEPVHPVTRNNVTFEVNDIKALLTIGWDASHSKFVSLRCDEDAPDVDYDGYNRPTGSDAECADTNPGTYHVLLTNYLGLKGESFVEDRTWDDEVWNQPLRGYRVTQQVEVTPEQANALLGVTGTEDVVPAEPRTTEAVGAVAQNAWHHQEAVAITAGERLVVTMTGSGDADLYLRWNSQADADNWVCRPWLNGSSESCSLVAGSAHTEAFVSVQGYAANSSFDLKIEVMPVVPAAAPTAYQFNDDAKTLFHVRAEVDYITEAASSTDGNLADRIDTYTRTDHYEYILELDADGKIFGGEWVGASRTEHPDFLWLPTGRDTSKPIAGGAITWAVVQELLDASVSGEGTTDEGAGTQLVNATEAGSLAKNEWAHFGPFEVVEGAMTVEMTGTGDADLYVRKGSAPNPAQYDCRPYKNGSAETCTAEGAGSWYVSVRGYTAATFSLAIFYTAAAGDVGQEPTEPEQPVEPVEPEEPMEPEAPAFAHLDVSGVVAEGEWVRYELTLQAGQAVLIGTTADADIDLYVRWGAAPNLSDYDHRPYTASGNETVSFVAPADGVVHIGVHGYEASDFALETSDG